MNNLIFGKESQKPILLHKRNDSKMTRTLFKNTKSRVGSGRYYRGKILSLIFILTSVLLVPADSLKMA